MALDSKLESAIVEIENGFEMWKSFEKKEDLERIEYFIARWLRKTNEIRANLKQEPLIMESRNGAHTPGPWEIIADGWITGPNSEEVTAYMGCGTHEAHIENSYDKALILAAPELLAALKGYVQSVKVMIDALHHGYNVESSAMVAGFDDAEKVADAAIAKATTPVDEK